jgi:biotin transport system substrate-specific component
MPATWARSLLLVVSGSLLVALCARISVPLPFTPIPVSLSNFGVLLIGLLLGGRLGCAALLLYLVEGSAGLPVFSNGSLGILGPTGGYLMAYPLVAFLAGALRGKGRFARALGASVLAEIILFAFGISWLMLAFHAPLRMAANWGLYPFLLAEIAKVVAAAGIANRALKIFPSQLS